MTRQREMILAWAESNNHQIVGWAEDLDISGSVDPFYAPALGPWLNDRADEFDVIVAWKLDRLGRNAIQLSKLFGWCMDHGKTVVSCSESIDLGNWQGRMMASVIAGLAEGELEAIRERTLGSRRKLRETSRWAGGRPPYGYRPVDNPHGAGKVLEIDPEAHAVVRRIVVALLDEVPLARIADELNRDGIRPPADHYRVSVGKEPLGGRWGAPPLRKMLQAPTLVGQVHLGGVTIRDDRGQPVMMAEPLVTDDERELIRAELARTEKGTYQRRSSGALVGVLVCYFCGAGLSSTVSKGKYHYYRCHTNGCTSLIPAADAETLAADTFLSDFGDQEVTQRTWVSGDSREADLRAAVTAFEELSATAGVMTSQTAKSLLQRQLAALDAQIAELESVPAREGHYEDRPTGEKYREVWNRNTDPAARREMLKRAGISFRMAISGDRRSQSNGGGAWYFGITSPVLADETAAEAERLRWGVAASTN